MADDTEVKDLEHDGEGKAEEDKKPPVRLTGAALRIHDKKIREEAKKAADEDDDEIELTPKAKKLIEETVEREHRKFSDDYEVKAYLAEHPDMRKHEKAIRERVEAWGDRIPVEEIAKTVAPPKTEAPKEVKERIQSKNLGGSSARAEEPSLPSTQEEFQKIYEDVKKNRKTIKLGEIE